MSVAVTRGMGIVHRAPLEHRSRASADVEPTMRPRKAFALNSALRMARLPLVAPGISPDCWSVRCGIGHPPHHCGHHQRPWSDRLFIHGQPDERPGQGICHYMT